jgi:hypothetical protein
LCACGNVTSGAHFRSFSRTVFSTFIRMVGIVLRELTFVRTYGRWIALYDTLDQTARRCIKRILRGCRRDQLFPSSCRSPATMRNGWMGRYTRCRRSFIRAGNYVSPSTFQCRKIISLLKLAATSSEWFGATDAFHSVQGVRKRHYPSLLAAKKNGPNPGVTFQMHFGLGPFRRRESDRNRASYVDAGICLLMEPDYK